MTEGEADEDLSLDDGRVIRASTLRVYKKAAGLDRDQAKVWFEHGLGPYDAQRAIDEGHRDPAVAVVFRDERAARRQRIAEEAAAREAALAEKRRSELGPWVGILDTPEDRERIKSLFNSQAPPIDVEKLYSADQFDRFKYWRRTMTVDEFEEFQRYVAEARVGVDSLDEWLRYGFGLDEIREQIDAGTTPQEVTEWLGEFGVKDAVLSLGAIADLIGINPVTLRMWRRRNDRDSTNPFPASRQTSGRSPLFSVEEVVNWIRGTRAVERGDVIVSRTTEEIR